MHLHLTQQNGRCQPNDDQTLYMLLTYRFTGKFFILLMLQLHILQIEVEKVIIKYFLLMGFNLSWTLSIFFTG